jgi:hypothetical protein
MVIYTLYIVIENNQPLHIDIFGINRSHGDPIPSLRFRGCPAQPQHHVFAGGLTYNISGIRFFIVVTACAECTGKHEYKFNWQDSL